MSESGTIDDLDRSIVLALQVEGRARWSQIATALGEPESTITRRGRRLLASRRVAVTGLLDHLRTGLGISIHMRLHTRPGAALTTASALVEHPDVRYVAVAAGSLDVIAEIVAPSHRSLSWLVDGLPDIVDVLDWESTAVLRKFSAFEEWTPHGLSGSVVERLRGTAHHEPHRAWHHPEQLSEREFAIAAVLATDGRASHKAIATQVGASESIVARTIDSLVDRGCLRFRAVYDSRLIGDDVEYVSWLTVDPTRVEDAGEALIANTATRYVSAITGRHNLLVHGALPEYGDLYDHSTHVVGATPGLVTADYMLLARTLKRAWLPVDESGCAGASTWRRPKTSASDEQDLGESAVTPKPRPSPPSGRANRPGD